MPRHTKKNTKKLVGGYIYDKKILLKLAKKTKESRKEKTNRYRTKTHKTIYKSKSIIHQ